MEEALKDEIQPTLRRSNSQRVKNTRDQVFIDMKEELLEKIKQKDLEINEIQKNFNDKVEALTIDMSILQSQLPSNKYRSTRKFQVLPGYKIENSFQYPDMLSLTELSFEQLQPMRFGLN